MPMSISQAAPAALQATTSSAVTKGNDGNNFVQTLMQMMNGDATGADVSSSPVAVPTTANALQTLLSSNLSAADMLSVIEQMITQLGENDDQSSENHVSESDLNDALEQLDELLAWLSGIPLIPMTQQHEVNENTGAITESLEAPSSAPSNSDLIKQTIQTVASSMQLTPEKQGFEIRSNPEAITALKASLQDALGDLKVFLQQGNSSTSNSEQLTLIGKPLTSIQQLLDGVKPEAPVLVSELDTDVAETLKSLQSTSTVNTHFHRMANQLLPVGLLSAVSSQEDLSLSSELIQQDIDADSMPILNGWLKLQRQIPSNVKSAVQQVVPVQTSDETVEVELIQQDMDMETVLVVNGGQDIQRQVQFNVKPAAQQAVPIQHFAEKVEGLVVKQFSLTRANGMSEARISLFPEHLGQVDVRISVINGLLTAHFQTDTITAKDMLENQMSQLRTSLQSQGLQVDKLEVTQTAQQSTLFQDRQGQNGRDQQTSKRNKSHDNAVGEINFSADLEEVQIEQAVDRDMGLGRGIHTTA